jgi:hypothetical protein
MLLSPQILLSFRVVVKAGSSLATGKHPVPECPP